MKILACYSMKGGVGKTATAVNLAWFAASSGFKTLLVDMDPQGASSFYFRVKSKKKAWNERFFENYKVLLEHIKSSDYDNLDVLPAHLSFRHFDVNLSNLDKAHNRLKKILKGFKSEYDLIVLDCPPSISLLSENVFRAADVVLVPVIPTTLSERTLEQVTDFFKDQNLPTNTLLPFFSMVQRQKHMHSDTMQRLKGGKRKVLKTAIPFSADIEKMGEHRAPLGEFGKSKPAYVHYRSLWNEVNSALEAT